MKRSVLFSLSFVLVVMLAADIVIRTQAASNLSISKVGDYEYAVSGTADTDDMDGEDLVCVVCRNANGSLNDVDIIWTTVGDPINSEEYRCSDMWENEVLPLSVAVYDIGYYGDYENTEAAAAYCESYTGPSTTTCIDTMPIPEWAVGGAFLSDAVVYWAPDASKATEHLITAGNTARVLGLDETGQYAKIIWVCDMLWVEASTLGPNYDAPWYGAPLPTVVVD